MTPPKKTKQVGGGGNGKSNSNSILAIIALVAAIVMYSMGGSSQPDIRGNDEFDAAVYASSQTANSDPGQQRTGTIHEDEHEGEKFNYYENNSEDMWLVWICYTSSMGIYRCGNCDGGIIKMNEGEVYAVLLFPEPEEKMMYAHCVSNMLDVKEFFKGDKKNAVNAYNNLLRSLPKTPPANM